MSQFKYTLPSGETFNVDAPNGTTQAEADYIFYSQVASGALVGFAPGQSTTSVESLAVKFALSRLDRGTAGVDDQVILSIVSGIPTINGELIIDGVATVGIPNLTNVPLENPITQADFVNINNNNTFAPTAIGPLNPSQVQGLMAQVANFVGQPATTLTQSTGVGIYGLFCEQLEQAGYVKPGTYLRFIAIDPNDFISTLNSPGIWTGLNGIYNLDDFLNSLSDQNTAQLTLMKTGYESLTAVGTIAQPATQSRNSVRGYVYTQSGLQTVSAVSAATGITLSALSPGASSIANTPLASLLSTPLTNVGSLASGAVNSSTTGLSNLSSTITSTLKNAITSDIGALVNNASKFGTNLATDWAKSLGAGNLPNLSNLNLNSLSGLVPSNITGLASNIQNLDVLGKASQFASGFSNPLTGLSNLGNFNLSTVPNLGSLTAGLPNLGSLTSGIPNIGSLTAGLPSLSNLSSIGNFSSLADLSSLGNLGSLGSLFGGGGDSLVSATKVAAGFTNTVNRSVVDAAVKRVLGNAKIPTPQFGSLLTTSATTDVSSALGILQGIRTSGNGFGVVGGGFGGFLGG